MNRTRYPAIIVGALLAASCFGCQYRYTYVFRGLVKSAVDGTPIENVEIDLNHFHEHMGPVKFPVKTDSRGYFEFEWAVSDATFIHNPPGKSIFVLYVKKSGYHSEEIDLGIQKRPETSDGSNQIFVLVQLRPETDQ